MTKTLIQEIASTLAALRNSEKTGNTIWATKWRERLATLEKELPSGAGIDSGTTIRIESCSENKIVLDCGFHHMNDVGYYDGWTEHTIFVRPSFDGISLTITGRDRNDVKDYLAEVYSYALTQPVREGVAT